MKNISFTSLRLRLVLLVLAVIVPVLGLIVYRGIEDRNKDRLEALADARGLARNASALIEHAIVETRQIFFTLSQMPQFHQQDSAACSKIFADLLKQTTYNSGFAAAKPNGEVFASAAPLTIPVSLADRPWFQRLVQNRGYTIGEYSIGRFSGRPTVVVGYPVLNDAGQLTAVLTAGLDLERLQQALVAVHLSSGATYSVIDRNGTVLIRYPDSEKFAGQKMPESSMVKTILTKKEGVMEEVGLDGMPRLYGYTTVGSGIEAIHIAVGIPELVAYADLKRHAVRDFTMLGLVSALALLGAWLFGKILIISPVNRLIDVAKRLAEGDLTIRSDRSANTGELGLLASSFDQMAGALQRREEERKRAEEERRRLEERLQRSEKMEALGQLAGGVAHDLNNVLGVLSGYSELLLEEIPEGHRSRGHAEKILQSTEKGAAIIQDLLTMARRGVTGSEVVNLNSVVSGFLKAPVFERIKDHHPRVTFRAESDKALLNIKGSPVHLEKTLMNLVSNAAESISGKGEVTIRTENRYLDKAVRGYDDLNEGDYAVLSVSDTGMGIPAENREKIFEPFYTKKTMGKSGTGLGLSIVWGTVKDHSGYIDVQTEVGQGSTFTLYFPATREEPIAQEQKLPIEQYMGTGESVLVVDDVAEQREVALQLLTRLGYEVHAVSSGEEAVAYLKGNKSDILVLDMIMPPGMDGLETYRQVLTIHPKQKAIIVSGFTESDRVREAQKLGAGAYVKKPYIMEKIGMAMRQELDRD